MPDSPIMLDWIGFNRLPGRHRCFPVAFLLILLIQQFSPAQSSPPQLKARIEKMQTPVNDELLYELEKDFIELTKASTQSEKLLVAEELLMATNDNSHWTNYSQATKVLKDHPDVAAIPLLLRYMVLHTKRSAAHIMIPEYQRTLESLSGKRLEDFYQAGPNLEMRVRTAIDQLVSSWWRANKRSLEISPEKMQPDQLDVRASILLETVRRNGDFDTGGKRDTAYSAYHNMNYRVRSRSSEDKVDSKQFHVAILPVFLKKCGYKPPHDESPAIGHNKFPFEFVIVLAEYAGSGKSEMLKQITNDNSQSTTVRIVCALSLVRANCDFPTDAVEELLATTSDLEEKLICLLALRWAGAKSVPLLLEFMDHDNQEIATAAACALCDAKPHEAVAKYEKLFSRPSFEQPTLLLTTLVEYKSPAAKTLLKKLLTDALNGSQNQKHLSPIVNAFSQAWGIKNQHSGNNPNHEAQAHWLLLESEELEKKAKVDLQRQQAAFKSVQLRLSVAEEIEALRRKEHKRLLDLQGEEVVTLEECKQAYELLNTAVAEVKTIRTKLLQMQAELRSADTIAESAN